MEAASDEVKGLVIRKGIFVMKEVIVLNQTTSIELDPYSVVCWYVGFEFLQVVRNNNNMLLFCCCLWCVASQSINLL